MATLKNYIATSTQKVFQIQHDASTESVYFGNVEKHDDVFNTEMPLNRGCLKFTNANSGLIHPLYESSTILFHGLGARRHRYPYAKKDDYQHIYHGMTYVNSRGIVNHLNNGLTSIAKAGDAVYGLDTQSTIGHYYVNDEMYDWLAQDNGYAFPVSTRQKTYLYNSADDIVENIDVTQLSTTVSAVVDGIEYNTLFEVPGGIYTKYSSGSMFATTVKTKNQYNEKYDMRGDLNGLTEVREYEGIFSNNNQVYLLYHTVSGPGSGKRYSFSANSQQNNIDFKSATKTASSVRSSTQQVEVIQNLNRGVEPAKHKSSLYKLKLTAPFINDLQLSNEDSGNIEMLKKNVKQEIRNMVRSLAEKVSPANSQLFNVEINNDLTEYQGLNYIKVSLDANQGLGGFVKYYLVGDVITLPLPTRVGYEFLGWLDIGDSNKRYRNGDLYVVTSTDTVLSADWTPKTVRYSFTNADGGIVETLYGTYGQELNKSDIDNIVERQKYNTCRPGYTFTGFSPDVYKQNTYGIEDCVVTPVYEPLLLEMNFDNEFQFNDWNKSGSTEIETTSGSASKLYSLYNANDKTATYQIGINSTDKNPYTVSNKSQLANNAIYKTYAMVLSTGVDYTVNFDVNVPKQLEAKLQYRTDSTTPNISNTTVSNGTIVRLTKGSALSVYADLKFTFKYDKDDANLSCRTLKISNIRVFPTDSVNATTCSELRRAYRYSDTGTYGNLPEPTRANKVFDGWYPISYEDMLKTVGRSKRYEWKKVHRVTDTSQLLPTNHTLYSYWTD